MRVLNVFDLGSFVHAGACNTHAYIETEPIIDADGYRLCRIPCGGIAQVLSKVKLCPPNSTFVFACDRNPTIKKGMFPGYKASREHKRIIEIQKDITEYILKDCGFNVLSYEGYEADDIIYSVVKQYKKFYDKVNVYTADSDLYLVVDDNVEIQPSHSRAKHVTKENFSEVVSSKEIIPYNALTYLKIIRGDKSDEIPPLSYATKCKLPSFPSSTKACEQLADKEFLLTLGKYIGEEFVNQVNLVFPLTVDVPNELTEKGDLKRMVQWGKTMHCSAFGRYYDMVPDVLTEAVSELVSLGLYED